MNLREADSDDLEQILELFIATVRTINSKDYSQEQIDVWSGSPNKDIWLQKIQDQSFYVTEDNGVITGFSSIDSVGYLDFMYVHKDYQRLGIAALLLKKIENVAIDSELDRIWSSVSKTAQPFFIKHGYLHFEDEHKMIHGVHFKNALMEKYLK